MSKKLVLFVFVLVALSVVPFSVTAQDELPKIGFLPGVVDPFYQVMELGVNQAVADFGLEVVTQYPDTWGPTVQTPILDAMVARGDIDCLITAPTDKEQMIAPLLSIPSWAMVTMSTAPSPSRCPTLARTTSRAAESLVVPLPRHWASRAPSISRILRWVPAQPSSAARASRKPSLNSPT
jgi:hypothetical protein